MSTHSLNLLAMTQTHISPTENDSLQCGNTRVGFNLGHRAHAYGLSGGVGLFVNQISSSKLLIVPPIHPLRTLLLPLVHLLDL